MLFSTEALEDDLFDLVTEGGPMAHADSPATM
jgi:hypothetical protein